jgi:hypothetical protein
MAFTVLLIANFHGEKTLTEDFAINISLLSYVTFAVFGVHYFLCFVWVNECCFTLAEKFAAPKFLIISTTVWLKIGGAKNSRRQNF